MFYCWPELLCAINELICYSWINLIVGGRRCWRVVITYYKLHFDIDLICLRNYDCIIRSINLYTFMLWIKRFYDNEIYRCYDEDCHILSLIIFMTTFSRIKFIVKFLHTTKKRILKKGLNLNETLNPILPFSHKLY